MAWRKAGLREDRKQRNLASAEAAASMAVGDALIFATMCIVGLPVEVHARDGSVYSGIFHTASVDNDYAIVLKQARMTKMGNQDANVVEGSLIETLIVHSEDLVQVVAKGVLPYSNGITGYVGRDDIQAIGGHSHEESMDRETNVIKANESNMNKTNKSQSRILAKKGNGLPDISTAKTTKDMAISFKEHNGRLDTTQFVQIEESSKESVDGRQAGDCSLEKHDDISRSNPALQDERNMQEVRGSNISIVNTPEETNVQERAASDESAHIATSLPDTYVASIPVIDTNSESCLSSSSSSFLSVVPPNSSTFTRTVKESKLNPGAKYYFPSTLHYRTRTPPLVPNGASVTYVPDPSCTVATITAQQEVGPTFFSPSLPVKHVPYYNVPTGNGGNYISPHVQPIIRTQPARYAGQYNNFPTMPTYIHPHSQNVMHGRVGPLVCMHPISSDFVQSETAFSPATARPLLTPHHMHLLKHQGNASAQALQLCMNPPTITSGAQQFMRPSSIPVSQPLFPVLLPIATGAGSNVLLSTTKFA